MLGFAAAEQWWEEWQLRIIVLGSVLLQFFLMVAAALRRRRVPPWFRLLTWVAYQGSDALAFYALAILFSRHAKQESSAALARPSGSSAPSLEPLWAPILLLHLGGQDGIIAYSIQDIELWQRHFVIAASQIVIAVYVFRKSWPRGDRRLLEAAILLFIPGTLKCLEKPFALWRARLSSMAVHVGSTACRIDADNDDDDDGMAKMMDDMTLDEFVRQASLTYCAVGNNRPPKPAGDHRVKYNPYRLFVDVPYRYRIRLANLKYLSKKRDQAHSRLRSSLSKAFNRLYTNYRGYPLAALRAVLVLLTFVAIRLFNLRRHRVAYDNDDLIVTYVLLSCNAALECISTITLARCRMMSEPPWSDQVAQCNLLTYVAHGKKHRKLRKLASLLGWEGYLDKLWCTGNLGRVSCTACLGWLRDRLWCTAPLRSKSPPPSPDGITELVHDHISTQWREHIDIDAGEYRRFSDSRGQWTLEKLCITKQKQCPSERLTRLPFDESITEQQKTWKCHSERLPRPSLDESFINQQQRLQRCLWKSMRRPFDESIILWHLTTEICFFNRVNNGSKENHRCREISNYMVYLLLVNPEMLLPGARRQTFWAAYDDVVTETGIKGRLQEDGEDMARKMIQKVKRSNINSGQTQKNSKKGLVQDALELAHELIEGIGGDKEDKAEKMWRVIRGVWVEMLCFSAGRCSGYLHGKALGTGGEFLSYVWLLREYMGMRSFAEMAQRRTYSPEPVTSPGSPSDSPERTTGCWYFDIMNFPKPNLCPESPSASLERDTGCWYDLDMPNNEMTSGFYFPNRDLEPPASSSG